MGIVFLLLNRNKIMELITPLVKQWEDDKWDQIFDNDLIFSDWLYYQFFTFDGLTRTGLFLISAMRWEWGYVNNYYWYNGNNPGWYILNWLFNDNFLLGWIGFMIVFFIRADFLWMFTYIIFFDYTMKVMNRYYGTGFSYYGYGSTNSNYYNHYMGMMWSSWCLSLLMVFWQWLRYHFPAGEINLFHEFLDKESAADTPFCKWSQKLDSSPTLNMADYFGPGQNFCEGASAW